MTPLIISTRRSDATLRAIRSVTMVGNVSTFLTSSIGDPTGTQPTVGLTPRTITDPASFMVGPAGLEPATSSTPRKRATTCATARRQQLYRERANRERGDEDCGTKRATEEVRVIPSPFIPLPPGRGGCGWRPSAPHLVGNAGTGERGNAGTPRSLRELGPERGSADCEGARRNRGSSCDPLTLTLSLQGEGNEVGAPRRLTSGAVWREGACGVLFRGAQRGF